MIMDIEKLAYNHGANIYENGEVRFYTLNAFTKFAEAYHQVKGNEEIQALRAKVASAEVLVEALQTIRLANSDYTVKNAKATMKSIDKLVKEALATYDKLSEVKHDTE